MKAHRYLLLAPLLAACAQQPTKTGTIADLADDPLPTVPTKSAANRERAIAGYREFLAQTEDPILKAEAMRRLADLSLEEVEEKAAEVPEPAGPTRPAAAAELRPAPQAAMAPAAEATPQPSQPAAQPANGERPLPAAVASAQPVQQEFTPASEGPAGDETAEIIALYEERLRAYPYHPQNDQVLYQLSRAYDNGGRPDDELRVLDRLVSQYPHSPLLPEAQFRRGEELFVRKRYREADAAYRAVLGRGPESGFYEQALYKRAWSLFKQSLYLEGIDYFLALVDRKSTEGRLELDQLTRTERETIEDTLRAISLSFSYLEGPDTVAEYFRSRGRRRDEDIVYRALGEEYLKKERFSDAASSFQAFVAAYPNSQYAPGFQLRAIEAFRKGGFPSQVLEAQKAYVRLYDLRSPFWQNRRPEEHPEVVMQLQASLRDLARHYHAQAQKSKEATDYASAGDWYQRYLTNFPRSAGAQEVRFLYAELLYENKDYVAAADQYQQVAYDYTHNGRAAEAAYAAVLSLENHSKQLTGSDRLPWRQRILAAARRLAKEFPQHPKAVPALTHAAQQVFDLGDGASAAAAAQQLLSMQGIDPNTRLTALTIIGHTAFDGGDYVAAEAAYRDALGLSVLQADLRKHLGDRLAASLYKQGEQHRQAGDLAAAADTFLRSARAVPDSEIAATAQFDAAAVLIELQRWPQAIDALQDFRSRFAEHPQQAEVTRRLAAAYLAAGRSGAAADEYVRVSDTAATPELRRAALWQAAELYRKAGNRGAAAESFARYVDEFASPVEQAIEARQQLLELAIESGDGKAAKHWRQAIVEADSRAGSARSDRTRFLAAQAALALAEDPYRTYQRIRLIEPLKSNLRKKKTWFEKTLAAYTQAADYQVAAVTTQASYAIAELYTDFARALLESERPANLKGEALAQYDVLLEEEALPFENKGIEIHEINVSRTVNGLYDPWIQKSFDALAKLVPARYAKVERSDGFVETIH
jgi:TolA-binding protein